MKMTITKITALLIMAVFFTSFAGMAMSEPVKGIYLTQTTMEDTAYLKYLIKQAKAVGINTFVVDMEIPSKRYQNNVALLKANDLRYVARIIVFPSGGHPEQINSQAYWDKRFHLVQTAIDYGAKEIQLDYIRYNTKQPASANNAKQISTVVQYFRSKIPQDIPLQADVFGISSFGESKHIGQNLRLMSQSVNALCPMVYPSHFEPFREHAVTPYQTIYTSLRALRSQFTGQMPVKVYAYIEISNYRFPLPGEKRHAYVLAEMKAVRDANADGWIVWSAHNKYDYLFDLMKEKEAQKANDMSARSTMVADATAEKPATAEEDAATMKHVIAEASKDTKSVDAETKKEVADADNVDENAQTANISEKPIKTRTIVADAKSSTAEAEKPVTRGPVAATTWVRPMSLD